MVEKFLKAKHWQLFLLTFGLPFIFQLVIMGLMMAAVYNQGNLNPEAMFNYMKLFPLVMVVFIAGLFCWFWSVATGLHQLIPAGLKPNLKRFKVFFFIPLGYLLLFMAFFYYMVTGSGPNPALFALIVPLHLFSMFCIFYCIYFVAKTIRTAELNKRTSFSDFAGEFFLIWFFPIGVWFIQPRINRMVEDEAEEFNRSLF